MGRRDKATSNICTAQALLANISAMYAVYHGPQGLENMARNIHNATLLLAKGLRDSGNTIQNEMFFDTIKVAPRLDLSEIKVRASEMEINLRYFEDGDVGISLDETVTVSSREMPTSPSSKYRRLISISLARTLISLKSNLGATLMVSK